MSGKGTALEGILKGTGNALENLLGANTNRLFTPSQVAKMESRNLRRVVGDIPSLIGAPNTPNIPGVGQVYMGQNSLAHETARKYNESRGLAYEPPGIYKPLDKENATAFAQAYEAMNHNPTQYNVKKAYKAMVEDVGGQYEAMLSAGIKPSFSDNPYPNSPYSANIDVWDNKKLEVFPTDSGFGSNAEFNTEGNPLLDVAKGYEIDGKPIRYNDMFRAIHDYYGHAKQGNGFRAGGEENAYLSHEGMFSDLGKKALATETRGQNSYLNYGPDGETNRTATIGDTKFADQKTGLMDNWAIEKGTVRDDARRRAYERDIWNNGGGLEGAVDAEGNLNLEHHSRTPIQGQVDPGKYGEGLSGKTPSEINRSAGPDFLNRSYYGIPANVDPYKKEQGLGQFTSEAQLPAHTVYDMQGDPDNLKQGLKGYSPQERATELERKIWEKGYSGFWANKPGQGKVAAIFDGLSATQKKAMSGLLTSGTLIGGAGAAYDQDEGQDTLAASRIQLLNDGIELLGAGKISTRYPSGAKAMFDPMGELLKIDTDAMKVMPEHFKTNVGLLARDNSIASPFINADKRADHVVGSLADNLEWMYDKIDPGVRDQSKRWYDGANKIAKSFSEKYGITDQQSAGVLASLSPQKDWYINASVGERVIDIYKTKTHLGFTPEMKEVSKRIYAKPQYKDDLNAAQTKDFNDLTLEQKSIWVRAYDEAHNTRNHRLITPEGEFTDWVKTDKGANAKIGWGSNAEIGKAISVLEDGSTANISKRMGGAHKVRNFYMNILEPNSPHGEVTIDTHAVGMNLVKPVSAKTLEVLQNFGSGIGSSGSKSSGAHGTYGLHADAYRKASHNSGVLPREMQSITWEGARSLFPKEWKTQENKDYVNGIWDEYKKGQITQNQARERVFEYAEGIGSPAWLGKGRSTEHPNQQSASSYQEELPGNSVPRNGIGSNTGTSRRTGVRGSPSLSVQQGLGLGTAILGGTSQAAEMSHGSDNRPTPGDTLRNLASGALSGIGSGLSAIGDFYQGGEDVAKYILPKEAYNLISSDYWEKDMKEQGHRNNAMMSSDPWAIESMRRSNNVDTFAEIGSLFAPLSGIKDDDDPDLGRTLKGLWDTLDIMP